DPATARRLLHETTLESFFSFAWVTPDTDYVGAWAPFSNLPKAKRRQRRRSAEVVRTVRPGIAGREPALPRQGRRHHRTVRSHWRSNPRGHARLQRGPARSCERRGPCQRPHGQVGTAVTWAFT